MLGNPLRFFSGPNNFVFRVIFGPFWVRPKKSCPVVKVLNPVRVPASTASLLGEAVCSTGAVRFPGDRGARGGVENDHFGMLSGVPTAPGARNTMSGNVPAAPGSLRRRLARLFYFCAGSVFSPRSFEGRAGHFRAHFIRRQAVGSQDILPRPRRSLPAKTCSRENRAL